MAEKSAYAVLGVRKDATDEEIKKNYIELVKRYDPERHTDRFMVIQKAYERLSDPRQRAREDVYAFNAIAGQFVFSAEEKEGGTLEEINAQIQALVARESELATDQALRKQMVDLLMRRSWLQVKARAWREAIKDWKGLLKIDPAHHRAKSNLAYALIQLGYSYVQHDLYEEAIGAYEAALNLNPDNVDVIHNLALACGRAGKKDQCLKYWQEVLKHWRVELEKNRDDTYLKERLVEAHKYQGDQALDAAEGGRAPQAAQREYGEALKIAPDDFRAQFQMAATLMSERNFKDAAERLRQLHAKHPRNTEVLNLLGWAYINASDHERGFQTWRRSLSLDPDNPETKQNIIKARMQLAASLRAKGQFTYALVHYKELQRLLPDSEEVQLEIAETFKSRGDKRSAEREYRRVIAMNPANKQALKGLSEIRMGS